MSAGGTTTAATVAPASAPAAAVRVTERLLDGPHGDLRVRVHEPAGTPVAGLVWAHGGAFYRGDLDMHEADGVARHLAAHGVVVVTVDYSLVPSFEERAALPGAGSGRTDVHFPVPSHELASAFAWAAGAGLGVAPDAWSVGGASAGGNLAAGAALRLRDAVAGVDGVVPLPPGTVPVLPRSVVLAYPVLHRDLPPARDELLAKVRSVSPGEGFPPARYRAMTDNYVGHDGDAGSPYAFPGGQDLRGLPPTLVLTSDRDALRASGEAFAAELAAAGSDVVLVREDATRHGHLNQPQDPGCARSLARLTTFLTAPLVGSAHEPPA
ncbi:acetyl esterase/lipase [Isoptericola jiangsuensis]|uniref:Acetyl esterase/lipase n=1 Tax=Isoptericola jiangsuensis TaxID=548579 RepID=A0A2A9EUN3_9MICO|nr:alpha/beta hydrolase fold domain-containing protein [Isoptericola jiangsuensis]PFG42000.1 acetyl esterase/lipase [Isoptericola jiangsuensis]